MTAQERGNRDLQRRGYLAQHLDRRHAASRFDLRQHRTRDARGAGQRIERQLPLSPQAGQIDTDQMFQRIEGFRGPRPFESVTRGIANQRKRGMHECLQ